MRSFKKKIQNERQWIWLRHIVLPSVNQGNRTLWISGFGLLFKMTLASHIPPRKKQNRSISKFKVFVDTKVSEQDYEIVREGSDGRDRCVESFTPHRHTYGMCRAPRFHRWSFFCQARYLDSRNRQECLITFDIGNEQSPREPKYNLQKVIRKINLVKGKD